MDRQEELESNEPRRRDKGFTLIELLIVIVILGILSTIVVLSVRGISDKGNDSACAADYKTLEVAHEAYLTQNNPSALPYGNTDAAEQALVDAGFLRGVSTKYNIITISNIEPTTTGGCTFDTDGDPILIGTGTAGAPGSWSPSGVGFMPASVAAANATPGQYVASPTTAWSTGQYVLLSDGTTHIHWDSVAGAWAAGNTP